MAAEMWNERYGAEIYAYGKEPNTYFKQFIDHNIPGKILLPGEGEGRNAVYAASKGWDVIAIDLSSEGKRKAEILAAEQGVQIKYTVGELNTIQLEEGTFDAIALIFFHLPESVRLHVHKHLSQLLKPEGLLLIESFSKNQLGKKSGGPPVLEMLYDKETLAKDFNDLEILELKEVTETLNEGPFHQGIAALTRMTARKH